MLKAAGAQPTHTYSELAATWAHGAGGHARTQAVQRCEPYSLTLHVKRVNAGPYSQQHLGFGRICLSSLYCMLSRSYSRHLEYIVLMAAVAKSSHTCMASLLSPLLPQPLVMHLAACDAGRAKR